MINTRGSRRLRRPWTWLSVLMFAFALVACTDEAETPAPSVASPAPTEASAETSTPEPTPDPTPISIVDSSGFTFVLDSPAQRVISHSPAATEILFAIGAGSQVVARDNFSNYPAEVSTLPEVAYSSPEPEQDLAHDPDLVILSGRQRASVEQFRGLDIPIFFLEEPTDLAGVMGNIRIIATLTGHEAAAEELIAALEARLSAVSERLEAVTEGPRVFYELTDNLHTVSPASFIGSALSLLKVRNIAAGAEGAFPQLSSEAVVDADPEVILMADASFVPVESVPGRPGWSGITAVVDGRIYPVDGDIMSRPGPRIVDGIEELAALFYPDLFE
ncbi:MAG: ABC transporter substrate-binding protein [Dehalococcoidia bacterium]